MRLADGYRDGEGRVEIFHDGHWGTVCDDFWDIKDAQVVCRELGYSRALLALQTSLFGEGNGHIWLDNVHCVGNESSIANCQHNGWNDNDCYHYEDASVICSNTTGESLGECRHLTCISRQLLYNALACIQELFCKVGVLFAAVIRGLHVTLLFNYQSLVSYTPWRGYVLNQIPHALSFPYVLIISNCIPNFFIKLSFIYYPIHLNFKFPVHLKQIWMAVKQVKCHICEPWMKYRT